jgi:hypothetical protein
MFNVACFYNNHFNPAGFKTCKANSVFQKAVTPEGGEVADDSPDPTTLPLSPDVPTFKVECDNVSRYNDHSRRFTDLLSTRIQAMSGPMPAIYLPRGELHTGNHVSDSYLEIDTGIPANSQLRINGKCYIWTGSPL